LGIGGNILLTFQFLNVVSKQWRYNIIIKTLLKY